VGQRTSKGCFFLLVLTETLFALLGEKMFNLDQYRRIGMHEAGVRCSGLRWGNPASPRSEGSVRNSGNRTGGFFCAGIVLVSVELEYRHETVLPTESVQAGLHSSAMWARAALSRITSVDPFKWTI
jgi:hypothetical protein